jgi:Tat protein secretion system quality control protein TatD with DNase activity
MEGSSCRCCYFPLRDLFLPPSEQRSLFLHPPSSINNQDESSLVDPLTYWAELHDKQNERKTNLSDERKSSDRLEVSDCGITIDDFVLVDTHCHAHLNREAQACYESRESNSKRIDTTGKESSSDFVVALSCAVEEKDWNACLLYAAESPYRVAALGLHPWYLTGVTENWEQRLESLLIQHPGCMVGEIGLCKMARFVRTYEFGKQAALELQRKVFVQQLILAAKYRRPVSVHCVDQHGVLMDILSNELDLANGLPPTIALHSFSGTAHQVQQLLKWEDEIFQRRKTVLTKYKTQQKARGEKLNTSLPPDDYVTPLLYFGFSHSINYAMCSSDKSRRQGRDAIRAVPLDRLLAESDVHCDENVVLGVAGAVSYIAWALDESDIEVIAQLTRNNGLRFLQRLKVAGKKQSEPNRVGDADFLAPIENIQAIV